jgi:lipid A ethanolaminephosphotransferase
MFSPLSQDDYSRDQYFASENLVDVISRAGFDVQWWDNNTGDQTVMQRLDWAKVDATWDPDACAAGECTDAIFLPLIDQVLETATGNTLLILHMIGSHGPAYFMRYPESRAQFTPDCRSAEFADCTDQEIINAYDNTIIEADYVLAGAIERLSQAQNVDTAMLYISDHGESLGEGGVFLHGLPRFMAPDVQTHVPFLVWLGQSYHSRFGIDQTCLESNRNSGTSQDMVFHSMLGLLNLDTEARNPRLDITTACSADAG